MTDTAAQSGFAPVNGLQMNYGIHVERQPLVLPHGGFNTIAQLRPISPSSIRRF